MQGNRILSVDIYRSLTMFFMIFVNDLWTLSGVPDWLKHTAAQHDGMGFSDIIFPMFLFIVGLSIPLAIQRRKSQGQKNLNILLHIIMRSFSLIVMGVYMVNYEYMDPDSMVINKPIWLLLMACSIFLIWIDYQRIPRIQRLTVIMLRTLGVVVLLWLAIIYRGIDLEGPLQIRPHWWGILGLIGWAYLLISILWLYLHPKWTILSLTLIFFLLLNVLEKTSLSGFPSIKLIISASNYFLVLAGALSMGFYRKSLKKGLKPEKFMAYLAAFGLVLIALGFLIRPYFIISKILATPSWTTICTGINIIIFAVLILIVDRWSYAKWARPIAAAGTSTLTCYLIPYFIYPLIALMSFQWPQIIATGFIGILKSLVFSFLIIQFVGWLEKRNIKLSV